MKNYYIYYNNKYVRQNDATISVLSASAQFGLNVFEATYLVLSNFSRLLVRALMHQPDVMRFEDIKAA